MAVQNELGLNINLKSGTLDQVAGQLERAHKSTTQLGGSLTTLEKQLARNKQLQRLQTQTASTANELNTTRKRIAALRKEMAASEKPNKRLTQEIDRLRKRSASLHEQHGRNVTRMRQLSRSYKEVGGDLNALTRDQQKLNDALKQRERIEQRIKTATAYRNTLKDRGSSLARVGGAGVLAGAGAGRGLYGLSNRAMAFETAMVEVDKFVKNANLPVLRQQILSLGKASPLGADGIAALVAAAGKINLPADQALAFAKITEQMSVALGIGVEETADNITRLRSSMNLSMEGLGALGDAINYFGDKTGSNAEDILNVLSRSGSIAKTAGLSDAQSAALAAVIAESAPSAEIAATGMKNILATLSSGTALPKNKQDTLNSLGFDPGQIAAGMQENAAETIDSVFSAIAEANAEQQIALLGQLFDKQILSAGAGFVNNLDGYRQAMLQANDATLIAGSAQKEYERSMQTNAVRLAILKSKYQVIAIQLGDKLLPIIERLTTQFGPMLDRLSEWVDKNPEAAAGMVKLVAGLAAGGIVFGGAIAAVGGLISAIGSLGLAAAVISRRIHSQNAGSALAAAGGKKGGLLRKLPAVGLLAGAGYTASTLLSDNSSGADKGGALGGLGGASAGALAGASIGSVVPVVGTAIGGLLGGLLGGWLGEKGGETIGGIFDNDLLPETPAQMGSLLATAGAAAPSITNKSDYRISVTAAPGDDPNQIARAVAEEIDRREQEKEARIQAMLHDTELR